MPHVMYLLSTLSGILTLETVFNACVITPDGLIKLWDRCHLTFILLVHVFTTGH